MARDSRYKDFLDYTVTYKSMWTIVGLVVALAVAGWFAWQKFKPAGPDEKARQVIKDAGRLEKRAADCVQDSTPATFLGDLQAGREKLAEARTRLDENARMLRHRMDAIREIADLISEEIRDADSDGTYSVGGGSGGARF